MPKQVRGFVTCDTFINNNVNTVSSLYELSDLGLTFSRNKQQYYSTLDTTFSLYVFKEIDTTGLLQFEVNNIINVVKEFVLFCTNIQLSEGQDRVITFMTSYNASNSGYPVSNLNHTTIIETEGLKGPGYMSFTVAGVICSIWLNDANFRGFYPDYDIDIVYPITDFNSKIQNVNQMVEALTAFKFTEFNARIETAKGQHPTTYVKILNIPYQIPGSNITKDCYFAFNQYGAQGNYDYVLKLKLYEVLLGLGMNDSYIQTVFPSILKINEFFFTPRWDRYSIPTQIGENGILSQISKAFTEVFDLTKFVKVYPDEAFLRANSYNLPYDYRNILLTVSNGFYTEQDAQDFKQYYPDFISVTSPHPDFSRMSMKTQHLVTLLENMLSIADSETSVQMFNKMLANTNYVFSMITRQGVWYLSIFFEKHQIYLIPKFEYNRLLVA